MRELARRSSGGRVEVADPAGTGLRLRVGPRAVRWTFIGKDFEDRRTRLPVGDWPEIGLAEARQIAGELRKMDQPSRRGSIDTVADLLAIYRLRKAPHLKRGASTVRSLEAGLLPLLHRPLVSLGRRDIADAIHDLSSTAPSHANRTLAYTKALFSWAVRQGYMESNPAAQVARPATEVARDHTPTLTELAKIWKASELRPYPYRQLVQLLMLTACRRDELGAMRISELDLPKGQEDGVWTLPAARSKNGRAIRVPLSPAARQVVEDALAYRVDLECDLVFSTNGRTPFSGWSKAKHALDRTVMDHTGEAIRPWRLHDFRRAFATHASDTLEVPPEVADRCLNHIGAASSSTVARVYARNELFTQRRQALLAWSTLIEKCVTELD